MKKDILVFGCSQSSGAELSDSLAENYWNDFLTMKDPYEEWFNPNNAPIRVNKFHEYNGGRNEDWEYNFTQAWPHRIQSIFSDTARVIDVAKPGGGAAWTEFLVNCKDYYFVADSEEGRDFVGNSLEIFHKKGNNIPQTFISEELYLSMKNKIEKPPVDKVSMQVHEMAMWHLITSRPENYMDRFHHYKDILNPSTRVQTNDPEITPPDYTYRNILNKKLVQGYIDHYNRQYKKIHKINYYRETGSPYGDERAKRHYFTIRDHSQDFLEYGWKYNHKDISDLIWEADVLVWQWTNEPRLTITDPGHNKVESMPTIKYLTTSLKEIHFDLELIEYNHQYKFFKKYERYDPDGFERLQESKNYWQKYVEEQIDYYTKHYDHSANATHIINWFNYVVLKRKSLGKKTIFVTMDMDQLIPYNMKKRLELDETDAVIDLSRYAELRMEDFEEETGCFLHDRAYGMPSNIKKKIRYRTWPFQRFMHYSLYAQELIANIIAREIERIE
jgi:hypothetical protein